MQKLLAGFVLVLASPLVAPPSLAQDVAPDALLKSVTLEVLATIRQDKEMQAGNAARIAGLVETRILPHFDFPRMTQIAVARNWRLATPEQQQSLIREFRTLLVRTYSVALSSYRDQVIEFRPLRAVPGATEVTVKSVIRQAGTAPLTLDYDMENVTGEWKVYDIKVEGMSLITTYRATFADKVREAGVDGLIRSLADKNRQGDARFRTISLGPERSRQESAAYFMRSCQAASCFSVSSLEMPYVSWILPASWSRLPAITSN